MAVILAIDPSTTVTGWAVFSHLPPQRQDDGGEEPASAGPLRVVHSDSSWELVETGIIIAHNRPKRVEVSERIQAIKMELTRMVDKWRPLEVACGKPAALQLPYQQQGIEMLGLTLERWAEELGLPLYSYLIREIREAMVGRPNCAKEELAYTVMNRWGLLGTGKSSHEWCAIAVGDYHLERQHRSGALSA